MDVRKPPSATSRVRPDDAPGSGRAATAAFWGAPDRPPVGTKEEPAMPSDGRGLVRFVNIVWVVWLRLALGTLGYFVSLGI